MRILPKLVNNSTVAQAFQPVQAQAEACGYILQEAPKSPFSKGGFSPETLNSFHPESLFSLPLDGGGSGWG
jgi:hypothetical protein